jgi:hypothetical protein
LFLALLGIDYEPVAVGRVDVRYIRRATIGTVVAAKYAKSGHAEKGIGTELIEDIARYQ